MNTAAPKLSQAQYSTLQFLSEEGASLHHNIGTYSSSWYVMPMHARVSTNTAESLRRHRLIESNRKGMWIISDAGRAALEAANGVSSQATQNLNAAVTVYEAPFAFDAPIVPELSDTPDVDPTYLPLNVRLYVEADAREKRVNEAVEHPSTSDCLYGVCKGDRVRVATTNPNIPFEGCVEKMLWDGRVIVRNGSITYRTTVGRVTVLATVEEREEALTASTEVNAL